MCLLFSLEMAVTIYLFVLSGLTYPGVGLTLSSVGGEVILRQILTFFDTAPFIGGV